jgi:AcrR family transcriptional regulator
MMKKITIKKPQQIRSKAKYEAILQACPSVLAEVGYRKTTTARIALEADVSIGSLYDYFSCKEAIFIAYIDFELHKALGKVIFDAKNTRIDAITALRNFISVGIHFAYDQQPIIQLLFTEFPTELANINLSESKKSITDIAMQFSQTHNIVLAEKNIPLMLYSLTNIILGFQCRIALMPNNDFERDTIIDELTDIIRSYIGI